MKIALCLSGQPRAFDKGYQFYKQNLFDHYDVDTYIHTWTNLDSHLKDSLEDLYKPILIKYEDEPVIDFSKYTRTPNIIRHTPKATYCAFYSIYQSSLLMNSTQIHYDWVLKSRTDYALNVVIPFEELDSTKLHIPDCRMVPERDFGNDQFAFSSKQNMMRYMSTFENIDKYYDSGSVFIGENLMQANIREHNLYGENLVYCGMNNPFPPGIYNGSWHSLIRDDYELWQKKLKD